MPENSSSDPAPVIGAVVGSNVRRLRVEKKWSQRDLHLALEAAGYNWNRVSLTKLEKSGVGGERLGDLVALADVLEVTLWDLLESDSVTVRGREVRGVAWIRAVLSGQNRVEESPHAPKPRVDPEADARFVQESGLDPDEVSPFLRQVAAFVGANFTNDDSFSIVRDVLAGVNDDMEARQSGARRGHATRHLIKAAKLNSSPELEKYLASVLENTTNRSWPENSD